MAHLQVTIDTNKLKDLFASEEGMAALAEQVPKQVLDAQMTEHLQAKPYSGSISAGPIATGTSRAG